jgi:hypothetical protein
VFMTLVLTLSLSLPTPAWAGDSPDPLAAPLARAAETAAVAQTLTLIYNDVSGLYGGDRYELRDGVLLHAHVPRRGQPPIETRATLTPGQLRTLARLLESERIWEQQVPERQPLPDESKSTLTVKLAGAEVTTWEWFNDMESLQRLVKVQKQLSAWAPAGAP